MSSSMLKVLFFLGLLATSCMAQAPGASPVPPPSTTPTAPAPSPKNPSPTPAPATPSPSPAPGKAAPTPSPTASAPTPSTVSSPAANAPGSDNSPASEPTPAADEPSASGSFVDGWVNRRAIFGTTLAGTLFAIVMA